MKTKTVRYEITYRSWTEYPPFKARHTDKLEAADDADALRKFNDLKEKYERCEDFKLIKIVRETRTSRHGGPSKKITVITETQLA